MMEVPKNLKRRRKVTSKNFQSDKKKKSTTEANANSLTQSGKNVSMGNLIGNIISTNTNNNYNHSPECQTNSPENDRMQSEELKTKLQCLYKKCILPCVHWIANEESLPLDEYYVQLEMSSVDGKTTQPIELKDIFKKQNAKKPKRILVEIQPGFGKTTLATKLIFDWAYGKEKYLKQFDLAFFIPLRQMKHKRLKKVIRKICNDRKCQVNWNNVKRLKMLLVLDGFDEISHFSRKNVLKVLYELKLPKMTILVTSRPGIFPMDRKELKKLFPKYPQRKRSFPHKKVTIRGIGVGDRKEFLTKFCPNPEQVLDKIASLPAHNEDMFSSPLLLLLISDFINLDMSVVTKSSITDLYKSLFSNLVKSSLKWEEKTISDQFDLFNVKDKTSRKYQEMLERFGILYLRKLKKLKKNVHTFESDGFIKKIYKLGLLTKHTWCIGGIFKQKEHFECFHLSFMEFCIAYSAWRKFERRSRQPSHTELFEEIRDLIKMSSQTSLIGLFLSGLLQQNVLTFLSHFESSDFNRSVYLWKMIGQLKGDEQFAKSILNVLKTNMYTSDDQSNHFVDFKFFSYVMRNGILMGYISIHLPAMIDCNLPVNIMIPNIHLTLVRNRENETQKKCVNYLKQIQCKTLEFIFDGKSSGDLFNEEYEDRSFLSDYFTLFLSIASERKCFRINN